MPKPYVMFTSKPGFQWYGQPGFAEGQINRLGYLGPLPDQNKPKGEYRIFVLGGSAAFQGKEVQPFSVYLEHLFHESGHPEVRVFNFSVVSSVSRQELIRILVDIAGYEPDLILSYTGYNDLYDSGWDPRINYPHRYILYEANPLRSLNVSDFKILPTLALSSQFLRNYYASDIFESLTEGIVPKSLPSRNSIRPLIAKAFVQNLRESNLVSEMLGAKYIAFLQPAASFKNYLTANEKQYGETDLSTKKIIRASVNDEARKFSEELHFVDLSDLFSDEKREVFVDNVHYEPQAWIMKTIAQRIYSEITTTIDMKKKIAPRFKNVVPEEVFTFTDIDQ